jgi:hypothetical protein
MRPWSPPSSRRSPPSHSRSRPAPWRPSGTPTSRPHTPASSNSNGCALRPRSHSGKITVATRTTDWWPPNWRRAGKRPDARGNRRKTPQRKTRPRRSAQSSCRRHGKPRFQRSENASRSSGARRSCRTSRGKRGSVASSTRLPCRAWHGPRLRSASCGAAARRPPSWALFKSRAAPRYPGRRRWRTGSAPSSPRGIAMQRGPNSERSSATARRRAKPSYPRRYGSFADSIGCFSSAVSRIHATSPVC